MPLILILSMCHVRNIHPNDGDKWRKQQSMDSRTVSWRWTGDTLTTWSTRNQLVDFSENFSLQCWGIRKHFLIGNIPGTTSKIVIFYYWELWDTREQLMQGLKGIGSLKDHPKVIGECRWKIEKKMESIILTEWKMILMCRITTYKHKIACWKRDVCRFF